jgi:hypothetical protein
MIDMQMREYHGRSNQGEGQVHQTETLVQSRCEDLEQLAHEYGIGDMMDFSNNATQPKQTLDEEYTSYVTVPLSPKGTDILKLWEVSSCVICLSHFLLLRLHFS